MSGSVYTLTDDERAWLKKLHEKLWPKEHLKKQGRVKLDALRPLTSREFERVLKLVETRSLLTSMFSSNMFGGYGMDVYEHEPAPGTGPTFLLRLVEDNLPGTTKHVPSGGRGRDDAWESFSRFTHSEKNQEWLKSYKMRAPESRSYYDY